MYSLDRKLKDIALAKSTPSLLLHCCCAPCASYVLEYISPFFEITILFFNPNIYPSEEYYKREAEFKKLLSATVYPNSIDMLDCVYNSEGFETVAMPYWKEPEGGRRCGECYLLRLEETAKQAKEGGYDYFATTLTVSPYKDSALLNEIGVKLEGKYGVRYLVSDFKKRDGYKRSIELSKQYGLYRQVYCGCEPSIVIR
ncbi:MAG: epoxyqueuosine reductase QueH [Oscillospiraceae bacterium]|nr:epoxyqueuosine reductase QueH [Oscillospiraceae bacterium]